MNSVFAMRQLIQSWKIGDRPLILNKEELKLFIPHRERALKIDAVRFDPSNKEQIKGFKMVLADDPDLYGHFPDKPMYPGVSIAECANLTAAMLVMLADENMGGYPTVLDFYCQCKRPLLPGDTMEIALELKDWEAKKRFYYFEYVARKKVGEIMKVVAEGNIKGTAT